jgi:hypothetical protein
MANRLVNPNTQDGRPAPPAVLGAGYLRRWASYSTFHRPPARSNTPMPPRAVHD